MAWQKLPHDSRARKQERALTARDSRVPGEPAGGLSKRTRLLHQAPGYKTQRSVFTTRDLSLNSPSHPGKLRGLPSLLRVPLAVLLATVYLPTVVFMFHQ